MHYKNGREAKNGDKVIVVPSYGPPFAGILYDAQPGNDTCNGKVAVTSTSDPMPNLKECLHADDVRAADVPDTSKLGGAKPLLTLLVLLLFAGYGSAQEHAFLVAARPVIAPPVTPIQYHAAKKASCSSACTCGCQVTGECDCGTAKVRPAIAPVTTQPVKVQAAPAVHPGYQVLYPQQAPSQFVQPQMYQPVPVSYGSGGTACAT